MAFDEETVSQVSHDSDVADNDSIFSRDQVSDSSQSSAAPIRSLLDEIYLLLRDDETLEPLYPAVFDTTSAQKFSEMFNGLMKTYCQNLNDVAQTADDVYVIKFIRHRLRQLSHKFSNEFGPKTHKAPGFETLRVQPNPQRRAKVIAYLEGRFGKHTEKNIDASRHGDEVESDSEDSDLDNLVFSRVKNFLISGEAWKQLRLNFEAEVRLIQQEIPNKENETRTRSILGDESAVSNIENGATQLQGSDIDVQHPQTLARRSPYSAKVRLIWTCRCGYRHSDDYEELEAGAVARLAEDLLQRCRIASAGIELSPSPRGAVTEWSIFWMNFLLRIKKDAKQIWNVIQQSLPHFTTLASNNSTNAAAVHNIASPATSPSNNRQFVSLPSKGPTFPGSSSNVPQGVALSTLSIVPAQPTHNARYLLFCSDSNEPRKVPVYENVDVCATKSDQELFNMLKTKYTQRKKGLRKFFLQVRNIHFIEVRLTVDL